MELENEEVQLQAKESVNGYVSCIIPENIENAILKVSYKGTAITNFAYISSVFFAIVFVVYIIYENKKKINS